MDVSLTRRAIEVNWLNLALGHQVFSVDGATFVRNAALPDVYDANFVFDVPVCQIERGANGGNVKGRRQRVRRRVLFQTSIEQRLYLLLRAAHRENARF